MDNHPGTCISDINIINIFIIYALSRQLAVKTKHDLCIIGCQCMYLNSLLIHSARPGAASGSKQEVLNRRYGLYNLGSRMSILTCRECCILGGILALLPVLSVSHAMEDVQEVCSV